MKIAIIGHGVVGKAFEKMVENHYELVIYDPVESSNYPEEEIKQCELGVICVPTNALSNGKCDTSIVEEAVKELTTPLILIKSTIEPGTTDELKQKYGKHICFSPEYIGESRYYHPYWKDMVETPYLIVGGDEQDCEGIFEILEPLLGPTKTYFPCTAIEAEIIKYMENCFFATKVTFVNEFYSICESFGANWHRVREGWLLDGRINKMHTSVFKNNRGFGGKCYPKDLKAIIQAAQKKGYLPELLVEVEKSNTKFRKINIDKKE